MTLDVITSPEGPDGDPHDGRESVDRTGVSWSAAEQMRLGLILIEEGEATPDQVRAALWASNLTEDSLVHSLTLQGVIRHDRVLELMERYRSDQISTAIRFDVPVRDVDFIVRHRVAIFGMSEKTLYLACLGNEQTVRVHFAEIYPNHNIRFMPVRPQTVLKFLAQVHMLPLISEERVGTDKLAITRFVPERLADGDVLDVVLNLAGIQGASDIHIIPKSRSYTIFLRVNRSRVIIHEGSLAQFHQLATQIKNRAHLDTMQRRRTQDGSFSCEILGRAFDLRVSTAPTVYASFESIIIRMLDPDKAARPLTTLGLSRIDLWRDITAYKHGIVLISGTVNSGKTTTLTATLREIDRLQRNIFTIEDPVENRMEFVTQIPINRAEGIDLDFPTAIRAALRQDVEVLVIGEIRDKETAKAMLQAGETGLLVLGTTHAGTVYDTVGRLESEGIRPEQLRPLVRGINAQRLMRTVCPTCRNDEFSGCRTCLGIGYAGMTVVSEMVLLPGEEAFDKLLARQLDYEPFAVDALRKLNLGLVDEAEVERVFATELKYVDDYAAAFPGVHELKSRCDEARRNPKAARERLREAGARAAAGGLAVPLADVGNTPEADALARLLATARDVPGDTDDDLATNFLMPEPV